MVLNDKERLLLSTKDCNKKLVNVLRVVSIICFVIGYCMLICFATEMDKVSSGGIWSYEPTMSDITVQGWLAIFVMIICFFSATNILRQSIFIKKAYMEIYELRIKGVCTKNINKIFSVSTMEFEIDKSDIVNITYQRGKFNEGNILTLYTSHNEYEMPITNNLYMKTIEILKPTVRASNTSETPVTEVKNTAEKAIKSGDKLIDEIRTYPEVDKDEFEPHVAVDKETLTSPVTEEEEFVSHSSDEKWFKSAGDL